MSLISRKKETDQQTVVKQVILTNKLGMHARPAAMFVKIVAKFQSDIFVEKDGEQVNGKSIMGLMMLAAGCGSKLKITAQGEDAEKVVSEIEKLILRKFDEE
jgi:phosphocarrier protein HPr